MNKLRLLEYNDKHIVYQYIPEDAGEPGEVIFDAITGEITIQKIAQNDESGTYGYKATRRIAEYIKKKNLPIDAIQAWY